MEEIVCQLPVTYYSIFPIHLLKQTFYLILTTAVVFLLIVPYPVCLQVHKHTDSNFFQLCWIHTCLYYESNPWRNLKISEKDLEFRKL